MFVVIWLVINIQNLICFVFRLGSDPEKLFPYDMMMEHLHKFGKLGLIFSGVMLPIITAEKGKVLGMDDLANAEEISLDSILSEKSQIASRKRLRDVVIDMARLEYI